MSDAASAVTKKRLALLSPARRALLTEALAATRGNRVKSAELLGITVKTCRSWIREFGLADSFPAKPGPPFRK